jgi:putative transcriptional regulator
MSISELVKSVREERNWSQAQLADALGVSQASISRWETGQDEPSTPAKILLEAMLHPLAAE